MIRFMSDTRYAGLEKEMQHIPGFCPRRSGMVISHLWQVVSMMMECLFRRSGIT